MMKEMEDIELRNSVATPGPYLSGPPK